MGGGGKLWGSGRRHLDERLTGRVFPREELGLADAAQVVVWRAVEPHPGDGILAAPVAPEPDVAVLGRRLPSERG